MTITFKEMKKNRIDHFYFSFDGKPLRADVVANKRIYVNDLEIKEEIESFMKTHKCYPTEEEFYNAQE